MKTTTPKKGAKRKTGVVTQNKDGSFTITGKLAEQVQTCAKKAGMTTDEYTDKSLREFLARQ